MFKFSIDCGTQSSKQAKNGLIQNTLSSEIACIKISKMALGLNTIDFYT